MAAISLYHFLFRGLRWQAALGSVCSDAGKRKLFLFLVNQESEHGPDGVGIDNNVA